MVLQSHLNGRPGRKMTLNHNFTNSMLPLWLWKYSAAKACPGNSQTHRLRRRTNMKTTMECELITLHCIYGDNNVNMIVKVVKCISVHALYIG